MKVPSISLKRTLDVMMKDTFRRLEELNEIDSIALKGEYKEWLASFEAECVHPHVLYIMQFNSEK